MLRLNRMVFIEFLQRLAKRPWHANKQPTAPMLVDRACTVIGGASQAMWMSSTSGCSPARRKRWELRWTTRPSTLFLIVLTNQSLGREEHPQDPEEHSPGSFGGYVSVDFARGIARLALSAVISPDSQTYDWWIGGSATPDERWTSFRRMNEQATIEMALFSPQDFIKQVPDPSRRNAQAILRRPQAGLRLAVLAGPGLPRAAQGQYPIPAGG